MSLDRRRQMIEPEHPKLSIARQCELVQSAGWGSQLVAGFEGPRNRP